MNIGPLYVIAEHGAIAVSAVGGVLAARDKKIDLFGVIVLALVTAFGGGTVRDVLVGDLPVAWLRGPTYLLSGTLAALICFAVVRRRPLPETALLVADAFALALFTIIGAAKGFSLGMSPPVSVLLGVVTGVAGGIIRDVLLREVPLVFQQHIHLYATAAMLGAICYSFLRLTDLPAPVVSGISTLVVLALRLIGIRLRLTLPLLEVRKE